MTEEEMKNAIKAKLQRLSKKQLIDVLTDICMASPAFRLTNALSSLKCTNIRDSIGGIQQVDMSFDPLKRISEKEVNNG